MFGLPLKNLERSQADKQRLDSEEMTSADAVVVSKRREQRMKVF